MKPAPPVLATGLAAALGLVGLGLQVGRYGPRPINAPIHRAIERNDLPEVRRLLDSGTSPNARTYGGMTALGLAVALDKREAADLLLQRGGDPNARVYGTSFLWVAAMSANWDGYEWLITHGAQRDPAAELVAATRSLKR